MIENISRRGFLKAVGVQGGVFVLAAQLPASVIAAESDQDNDSDHHPLGYFVSLASNGDVTIVNHRSEMGQGIITSVPQLIAEEMGADWNRVKVIQARGDAKYGDQRTGGSASIRSFFPVVRQMGAVARDMLQQAAAQIWQVDKSELRVANHVVVHKASGKQLGFAELADRAAKMTMPDPASLTLKPIDQFQLVGKDVKLAWQDKIITAQAQYAQDVQLPGMLIASIERPPVVGGKVKSFDATEAKKITGVVDVIQLRDRSMPVDVKPVSGVAVLATNTWAAIEGRRRLKVDWEMGANATHESETYQQDLVKMVNAKGTNVRNEGDVYAHRYQSDKTIEATYTVPYHHHMSMETPAATVAIEGDQCKVWSGTQNPQWGRRLVAEELGIDINNVEFNNTLMGGAFGRKSKNDFTVEAAELAKATGKPVKVVWSREDDVKHGFYHSISANYIKAELNDKGSADNWILRVAYPPIGWIFNHKTTAPSDLSLSLGFADVPFEVDHLSCEKNDVSTHVRTGWVRSVANINNAFALGSFVDELAAKANIPTHKMWHNLLGKDRTVDPITEGGFEGWTNYRNEDRRSESYALSIRRMKDVIDRLIEKSGADKAVADNEGWGISYAHSFNSYVSAATKVRVKDNKVELLEMHTVIDCGLVVTPDRVIAQMEGAMIMGISMALKSEITVKEGVIQQNNFYDYPVSRINEVPPLKVHLLRTNHAPGGVGEPGLPPVMPSITNAIFHASGKRIRDLPVSKHMQV